MKRSTLLGLIVFLSAVVFALAGGEYGTLDWLELRRQEREEARAIADLTVEVDSLKRYARAVETDRRLMEQIAREEFGMIRKGEFLYRLQPDTVP